MTRKEFLEVAAAVLGGAAALSALGCGGDGGGGGGGGGGGNGCTEVIQYNHGHSLVVTRAEAETGVERTYQMGGSADHGHAVTVTAAQYAELLAGGEVVITSTFDEDATHQHDVTIRCT